jgi:hypothetical protein
MKTEELIAFLAQHPGKDVEVMTETMICPVVRTETDCFDLEQGFVVLLLVDLEDE